MDETPKKLIILTGPTCTGKSALAIRLAKHLDGEVISADSMQVYRHMDIGTAKLNKNQMQGIRHHLIDVLDPTREYDVTMFKEGAKAAADDIYARGKLPILAGGTGFYIQAFLYDIDFSDKAGTQYRKELVKYAADFGNDRLFDMLKEADPEAASYLHPNDIKRVTRALEYYHETGTKISSHNLKERSKQSSYNYLYFVLNIPRNELYSRIDKRVDEMISAGLVDEVKRLKDMGASRDMVSMKALGYKEILDHLNGDISLDEAVSIIKRDTRHFAKRQLTWFKRERDVIWINKEEFGYDEDLITGHLINMIDKAFQTDKEGEI
ncbi:MAG: tRNA (adenosine(37)-N6)-dimethylallyltransferase MiaA [Lachnospiraceae bacterium]|nr:tRNA (adenosine(37)-N6)-dimethylallyltransferase MiaA [Lachnospiraceae bacterium]